MFAAPKLLRSMTNGYNIAVKRGGGNRSKKKKKKLFSFHDDRNR